VRQYLEAYEGVIDEHVGKVADLAGEQMDTLRRHAGAHIRKTSFQIAASVTQLAIEATSSAPTPQTGFRAAEGAAAGGGGGDGRGQGPASVGSSGQGAKGDARRRL
jgi:hypothetical protein